MKDKMLSNNLGRASSPYLQQHKDNPIYWQEWTAEVLEYAKSTNKPLFLSVGYATCHWCHVMAREAFSDIETASYINEHYVAIKVDREQRPDIDKVMMDFIFQLTGSGGWPLNVFLTPGGNPFYAITYAPVIQQRGLRSFKDIASIVYEFFLENRENIQPFVLPGKNDRMNDEKEFLQTYERYFDYDFGGFGQGQKFPQYCALLFMMYHSGEDPDSKLMTMAELTLDAMVTNGIRDHLQGGFFRYCVDREWTIPHFEKMLYDQAMLLWTYSLAYRVFKKEEYKRSAEDIIKCLNQTFKKGGLYISAHDADTNHNEGETYVWSYEELKAVLSDSEFKIFEQVYSISPQGNFEGLNHLIQREFHQSAELKKVEDKLLSIRQKREQPFADEKIITSWNALLGIGLVEASRSFCNEIYLKQAQTIFDNLLEYHVLKESIVHSSLGSNLQKEEFLEDNASLVLFVSYLFEETGEYREELEDLIKRLERFKGENSWIESKNEDFIEVKADTGDRPQPSSVGLADLALVRANILFGNDIPESYTFRQPVSDDFVNIPALIQMGLFHIFSSPVSLGWGKIPVNSIQRISIESIHCYKKTCRDIAKELLKEE